MRFRRDNGYAMVVLLVSLSVMAVLSTMAMPVWKQIARREKEAELVFRGEQYARAIGLFQRKAGPGALPPSIDLLVEQRYLRKKYKDPITNDDFAPIRLGVSPQSGAPNRPASPNQPGSPNQPNQPSNPLGSFNQTGQPGQSGQAGLGTTLAEVVAGRERLQRESEELSRSTGLPNRFGPPGQLGSPNQPGSTSQLGIGSQLGSGVQRGGGPGSFQAGTGQAGTGAQGRGSPGLAPGSAAGGIMGVASKSKEQSIRLYKGRNHYNEWEFVYTPPIQAPGTRGGGPGANPAAGQRGGRGTQGPGTAPSTPFGPASPLGGRQGTPFPSPFEPGGGRRGQ